MGIFSFVKPGKKIFDTITSVSPKVNKTKKDQLKSKLAKTIQKTKASGAKLDQTRFEIENKMPLTFGKSSKKTMSNTEKAQKAAFKKEDKKQENKTRVFIAPKNFNKGGRVGLKRGGGKFPDFSGDGKTTMKDILMARGVIPKPKDKKKMMAKKSKSPMDKTVRKA
jgi:hypothetical protein